MALIEKYKEGNNTIWYCSLDSPEEFRAAKALVSSDMKVCPRCGTALDPDIGQLKLKVLNPRASSVPGFDLGELRIWCPVCKGYLKIEDQLDLRAFPSIVALVREYRKTGVEPPVKPVVAKKVLTKRVAPDPMRSYAERHCGEPRDPSHALNNVGNTALKKTPYFRSGGGAHGDG